MTKRKTRRPDAFAGCNPYLHRELMLDIARRAARNIRRHKRRCRDCRPRMPCLVALQYADDLRKAQGGIADPASAQGVEVQRLTDTLAAPLLQAVAS